jgi:hypothetical protein
MSVKKMVRIHLLVAERKWPIYYLNSSRPHLLLAAGFWKKLIHAAKLERFRSNMLAQTTNVMWEEMEYHLIGLRYQLLQARNCPKISVLVNGSPKTGTTWMLNMIASIPGYGAIGNFNGDIQRYWNVLPGEVVHGHDWYRSELGEILTSKGFKVILLIRDPRDQVVSRMFHVKRSQKHTWYQRFQDLSNDEALMLSIEGREDLPAINTLTQITSSWINSEWPILCVRYEDLLADPVKQFGKVLLYLGIEDQSLAKTIVKRNRFERLSVGRRFWRQARKPGQEDRSSHYRKGTIGDWKNHFKDMHVQRLKEVAGKQLIELGYEQDLKW